MRKTNYVIRKFITLPDKLVLDFLLIILLVYLYRDTKSYFFSLSAILFYIYICSISSLSSLILELRLYLKLNCESYIFMMPLFSK